MRATPADIVWAKLTANPTCPQRFTQHDRRIPVVLAKQDTDGAWIGTEIDFPCRGLVPSRQLAVKDGTAARLVVELGTPSKSLDDLLGDAEAKAGSSLLPGGGAVGLTAGAGAITAPPNSR